jgi:hypothetical protein
MQQGPECHTYGCINSNASYKHELYCLANVSCTKKMAYVDILVSIDIYQKMDREPAAIAISRASSSDLW